MADYQMTGTEATLHIDFQGKAREALSRVSRSEPAPSNDNWRLVERYGNATEGWHLVFRRGEQVIDFDVHEDAWRAFDAPPVPEEQQ
jgi:hypothetical protein